MVRRSKRWIALLLTLIMAVSMVGCGNKTKQTDKVITPTSGASGEVNVTPVTAAPTEATNITKNDDYQAFDLEGRTIKVGLWWDYYYDSDSQDINEDPLLTNTETAQMKLDNVRRVEKKYNCKVDFVNLGWNGVINSINTTIPAGTPECDIYITNLQFSVPAAFAGLVNDLKDIALAGSDLFGKQSIVQPLEGLGGTYFFNETALPIGGVFMGYNRTMIQDLGLEDPQQLYKDGKWTWEKFEELAKAGTQDLDKDGTTDTYGYSGAWNQMIDQFVENNGGSIAGGETEGLSSKPVMEVLEFIAKLFNDDKVVRPWNQDNWDDNVNAFTSGKSLFWGAAAWLLKQQNDLAAENGGELSFDYGVVPFPIGPSGDGKLYGQPAGNMYMIPIGVDEPGKVLQVMEEFLNWYDGDAAYRDDPTWFESCFQTEEDVQTAYDTYANVKLDPWGALSPYFDLGSTVFAPICVDKSQTVSQAVEAAKPTLQSALDYFHSAGK